MKKDRKFQSQMRKNVKEMINIGNRNARVAAKTAQQEKEKKDTTKLRVIICVILLIAICAGFATRLFDWQIVHGEEYKELSAASTAHTVDSDATRGEILDVDGHPLAVNETAYNIVINKVYASEDNQLNLIIIDLLNTLKQCGVEYIDELPISYINGEFVFDEGSGGDVEYIESPTMLNKEGLTAQQIVDGLAKRYKADNIDDPYTKRAVVSIRYNMEKKGFSYEQVYVVASDVSSDVVAVVSERTQTVPAVEIRTVNERVIKNGTLIPHILGVVGKIDEDEYADYKEKGYGLDDNIGKFGIEAAMEEYLRGKAGTKTIITDEDGQIVGEEETVESKPGNTVYLTINSRIQEVAAYTIGKNIQEAQKLGIEDVKRAKANKAKEQSKMGEDCVAGAAVMLDVRDNVRKNEAADLYEVVEERFIEEELDT